MSCTNCFNGCEIVSDRCVKYTGIDIPELGIQTGDSLSHIEQAITTYLVSVLNGSGVKISLTGVTVCNTVQKYLPVCSNCTDVSIADIAKALINAACDLQTQIDAINVTLTTLNADYTIGCLTGVTASSDTHAIVQAVINKLCSLNTDFNALALSLPDTYVAIVDLPDLIQSYLNSTTSNLISNRMVPYAVVEYYGPLTGAGSPNFNGTGAGTGTWDKIYLCNGLNGTPDKRGVVGVGITDGTMLGTTMPAKTIPSTFNPTYSLNNTIHGDNAVTLDINQMPSHTHVATVNLVDVGHTHTGTAAGPYIGTDISGGGGFDGGGNAFKERPITLAQNTTGITVSVSNASQGGNLPHANNQPALGCYYIQYRP